MIAHEHHRASTSASNGANVYPFRPFILTERPDVHRERIARKRRALSALASAGSTKHEWIASVLGVSRQRVSKCLSEREPDEFTPAQMSKLGIAGDRAA